MADADTREKRMSMMTFVSQISFMPMFEANAGAALNLDDRQHMLNCYSGIAFSDVGASRLLLIHPQRFSGEL